MKKDNKKKHITNTNYHMKESVLNEALVINTIMNNSQDTIYFKDKNSTFLLSSKAHALAFGVDNPLEVIGKSDYDYFPEYFADNALKDEQQVMVTGKPIIGRIEKWIQPDGSTVWLSASKYPLFDFEGNIIGTWGTSRDITSLKKAQQELVELNKQLEAANRQLRVLSAVDSLSGLYNHRYFYEELQRAFDLYKRQKEKGIYQAFSIILFDIDDFKAINDTYGHLVGDITIRHIGEILREKTRSTDTCFRYGGDEFAILLLNTNLEETKIVAEKIRETIEKAPISHQHNDLKITISSGVASCNEAYSVDDLFEKADKKLYRSKNEGKNKVT